MKKSVIAYWVVTSLVAFAFAAGGVLDLMGSPDVLRALGHLGYPAYVAVILGIWKLLGVAAVLAPGLPRLKEWAYADMFFDLTGAAISHALLKDDTSSVSTPLVLAALVVASWALRPETRKLEARSAKLAPPRVTMEPHLTA